MEAQVERLFPCYIGVKAKMTEIDRVDSCTAWLVHLLTGSRGMVGALVFKLSETSTSTGRDVSS